MIVRLSQLENPRVARIYRYWKERCGPNGLMDRQRLDPLDLRDLLPNVLLVDIESDGMRCRIAGMAIESRYGRSLKGVAISETFDMVQRKDTSHQWREIQSDRKPKYRCGPMAFPNADVCEAERVLLPLSSSGASVDHILGAIFYRPLKPSAFEERVVAGTLVDDGT